jgi:predicted AAA+ superfamily ATPase
MQLPRFYDDLDKYLEKNKVLVIYGPRQVGKTTLLQNYLSTTSLKYKLDSGDNIRTQQILSSQDFRQITDYVKGYDLLAIDEAQRIQNVGMGLKILTDQVKNLKIIATGSSSFELSGQIGEPLTGRKKTIILYPFSQLELAKIYNPHEVRERLPDWLVFGGYPDVITAKDKNKKMEIVAGIMESYLLKDILELEQVKSSKILLDLLRLVSFQIGSEVSLSELGQQLGIDYKTVARYLDLFEKSFVLYNLRGYSRNLRSEITKKSKYYFYDNGIRNAVISNFNDLDIRDDTGKLWENFLVAERLKKQKYKSIFANNYFWRTWEQKEIDWVEERGGSLFGYEFKYSAKERAKIPKEFGETYEKSQVEVVNKENYFKFVI